MVKQEQCYLQYSNIKKQWLVIFKDKNNRKSEVAGADSYKEAEEIRDRFNEEYIPPVVEDTEDVYFPVAPRSYYDKLALSPKRWSEKAQEVVHELSQSKYAMRMK